MKLFLEAIWDLSSTIFLWFCLTLAFFVGLFLMGFTFKFIANAFLAGYHLI